MSVYGNLQTDKSQRKALEAILAGENALPDDAFGEGTEGQSLVAVLAERDRSVTLWGARADGTDCASAFRDAVAWLSGNARTGFVPAGTWTFSTPFSGTAADYTPLLSSLRGAGRELTILDVTHSTSYRCFRIGPGSGTARADSRSDGSPYATVRAIADIGAGQSFVTYSTTAELTTDVASGYVAKGEIFHVAGGKNHQDADDNLWKYDLLNRIVDYDTATGKVYLERAIPYAVTSDGWDGASAGKNTAATYANATGYTAGDFVWDNVATSTLYIATTSGTSNSANRSTDTGVTWRQVTTSLGSLKTGAVDHRPVFQSAYYQIKDLVFSDFTLQMTGSIGTFALEISSGYNIKFYRCRFINCSVYVVEGSVVEFVDCEFNRASVDGTNSSRKPFTIYNAHVRCVRCKLQGGNISTVSAGNALAKLESYGTLEAIDCEFNNADPAASQGYGVLIDRGYFRMRGGYMRGTRDPIRCNIQDYYEDTLAGATPPWFVDMKAVEVHIISKAFRLGASSATDALTTWYGPSNNYVIRDPYSSGGYVQVDNFRFTPTRLVPITFSFTPGTNQSATAVDVTDVALTAAGIWNSQAQSMVILGASVLWNTPGSDDLDIRFIYKQVGQSATRNVFSTTATSNRIVVNATTAYGAKWAGDGTTYRLGQSGIDYPRITYTSGASAGGTAYVTIWALL